MNKYEKAKIYKLIDNTNGNIYIGSTIQSLANRKSKHKQETKKKINKCKSKLIINNDDYDIILIENYPCSSKEELLARERYFIENMECINKNRPIITIEERKEYEIKYANKNKDLIKTKSKEWYKNNKDKKKEYDKKYKKQLADYQNSWCGNYRTNYENNLLKISMDIFE